MTRLFTSLLVIALSTLSSMALAAAPPRLILDVARFRNDDAAVKGGVVEVFATIPGSALTYKRRAPKMFQAAATLTLEVLNPDGTAAYQETVTLKPPVLADTAVAIKNPLSFQKRITLPDGTYTLRGQLRDQYGASRVTILALPLVLDSKPARPTFSDVVLLNRAAARSSEQSPFSRNGYSLSRAAAGLYARGAERLYFYAELYNVKADQILQVRYRLQPVQGGKSLLTANGTVTGLAGRSTPVLGELDLSKLAAGEYTLTVELHDAKNKVISSQKARVTRNPADYGSVGLLLHR